MRLETKTTLFPPASVDRDGLHEKKREREKVLCRLAHTRPCLPNDNDSVECEKLMIPGVMANTYSQLD